VGRNFGLNFVAVVTRMSGELATGIRSRSALILGRCSGASELSEIRRRTNKGIRDSVKVMPRFHWLYWSGGLKGGPIRIPDECTNEPKEYKHKVDLIKDDPFEYSLQIPSVLEHRTNQVSTYTNSGSALLTGVNVLFSVIQVVVLAPVLYLVLGVGWYLLTG